MRRASPLYRVDFPFWLLLFSLFGALIFLLNLGGPHSPWTVRSAAQPVPAFSLQTGQVIAVEAIGVLVTEPGSTARRYVKPGETLMPGSKLDTEANGSARLQFASGTIVRLGPNSQLVLTDPGGGGLLAQIQLLTGQIWAALNGGKLDVRTPTGVAAVRGSYMHVNFDSQNQSFSVECFEGQCSLTTSGGTTNLTNGQKSSATGNNPPAPPLMMTRAELVAFINSLPEAQAILATVAPLLTNSAPGGTVGGGGATLTGNRLGGTLNAGTANISFGSEVCTILCTALSALDPQALNSFPPGGGTLVSGLNFQVTLPPDGPVLPLVNISFQTPANLPQLYGNDSPRGLVIMQFDTSLSEPRWVALPTYLDNAARRLYARARLFGKNFALFRQY